MSEERQRLVEQGEASKVRWSRVTLAVVLVLLVGELVVRWGIGLYVGQPFRSLDPYVFSGYGLYRQNAHYTHPQFIHNSVGFRNLREFEIEKPPGTFRVLAIGASVLYAGSALTAQGFSARVPTDETITAHLERELRAWPELEGLDLEVINASVNRHKLRHTIAYYVAELARYRPDLVLVFGTHNDASFIEQKNGETVLFHDRARPTFEEARIELLANEASWDALVEKTVRVLVNRSALAAAAYRFTDRGLRWRPPRRASGSSGPVEEPPVLAEPEELERNLRFYLAGLDSLIGYIETQGAIPVVFWEYLLLMVADEKPLTDYEQSVADFLVKHTGGIPEEQKALKREVLARIKDHLEERGVHLIDPLESMRGYHGEIFNDYLHYSAEGNRWAARVVAEEIRPIVAEMLAARER